MITDIHSAPPGLSPPAPSVAAAKAPGTRPKAEDTQGIAGPLRPRPVPGGHPAAPVSLPGLGERPVHPVSAGRQVTPPDFPYLKPLAEANLGNRLNTLG